MAKYNWTEILKQRTDNELKKILNERNIEPLDKVEAAAFELKTRGIIEDGVYSKFKMPSLEESVIDINEVGETESLWWLAKLSMVFIGITIIAKTVTVYLDMNIFSYISSDMIGKIDTTTLTEIYSATNIFAGISSFLISMISFIIFIIWLMKSYQHLTKRMIKCKYKSGWAIGGWFVPVLSLFMPYEIMKEMVKKTDVVLKTRGVEIEKDNSLFMVGLGWTLYILIYVLCKVLTRYVLTIDSYEEVYTRTIVDVMSGIMEVGMLVITIIMIKKHSAKDDKLVEMEYLNRFSKK